MEVSLGQPCALEGQVAGAPGQLLPLQGLPQVVGEDQSPILPLLPRQFLLLQLMLAMLAQSLHRHQPQGHPTPALGGPWLLELEALVHHWLQLLVHFEAGPLEVHVVPLQAQELLLP